MSRDAGRFDYVVVGAGSAGCVLADRLSASGKHRVLLLEAGGHDRNLWVHVPLGYGKLFTHPKLNWHYKTDPEEGLDGREIAQPRGKLLGGSSSINGLLYVRGQPEDFDGWRQAGCVGWGYDDVLPYFIRSERQARGADAWHGAEGPLAVSDQSEPHPLCDAFIAAAGQAGLPPNPDFNGATQEGAGYYQLNTRGGRRCSAAVAYLHPARRRANLKVVTGAHATRVLWDGHRAAGVEWTKGDELFSANASAEVILSAGAINTPQILQLSGVGPGGLLRGLGVPVLADSPGVGEELQDHLQIRQVFQSGEPLTINDEMASLAGRARMAWRYLVHRKGPLTVSAGYAGAFTRTDRRLVSPDVQILFITFSTSRMGDRLDPFSGFTVSVCPLRPESRGWVRAMSPDPRKAPAIRANYLATPADRATAVAGMREVRRIMTQPPIARYVARAIAPPPELDGDDELLAYARATGSSLYHPTCSARMGMDPDAVVDPRLRVRGVDRLRIVDGSVMPSVVSGNTNAAIIMIAEKASDMILADAAA